MESFCFPKKKKFKLQPQQLYLSQILSSKYSPWYVNNNIRGILLYHQIGSGKTCTAISIAEQFKKKLNIVVVLPAALIGNFKTELMSECTNINYVKSSERSILSKIDYTDKRYNEIINKINKRIDKYYTIYSYHKFIALIQENKIKNLNDTLLIIDEIQNMISLNGTFYNQLKYIINKSNNTLKIILLSATPMFDKPVEIALTLNLLRTDNLFDIEKFNLDFIKNYKNMININTFKNKINGLISYYRGAPPQAYPKFKLKTIKCNMCKFQYKSYKASLSKENIKNNKLDDLNIFNMPQNFFLGPRMISNIAFPNKLINEAGYKSLKNETLLMKNITNYSIKFYRIIQKINQSIGPVFVYSNFKEYGGIKCFIKFLEFHGWKNYINHEGNNKYKNKFFSIWSGDEPLHIKEKIKMIFNKKENINGELIKIMLGSPSIKEGVSLFRVEQVHIMEPYWNMARMLQIMGRAIRFCSHKDLPKNRRFVDVFIYLATYKNITTIDKYIWSHVKKKNKLIEQFEHVLKEAAIDCKLFINRNSYPTDNKKITCLEK